MTDKRNTSRKLASALAVILLLCLCLTLTTFALVYSMVSVEDNLFQTGRVHIDLNGGQPVIREDEFLFEPGMTVKKDFYLENQSTCEIYYKLYFQNVAGGLADLLNVEIRHGDTLLYGGTPSSLSKTAVVAADDTLGVDERLELQIYFHFPEETGNEGQGLFLSFDMAAEGVQVKNNPNREFD